MHIQINLTGDETDDQLARISKMLGAYRGISDKTSTVDLEIRVDSTDALAELERFKAAVGGLKAPESVGEKLEVELLNKLEAENPQFCGLQIVENPAIPAGEVALVSPQFGRQPLPPGAVLVSDGSGEALPPFDATAERTAAPLAPSGAPSPAAAEASASAPAAAPASIPPPPSAASPVPSPPPAAATPAPAAAVDAKGLPWDERIHASSRAKIADGSWRMKRGVQSHVVEAVEAELRAQMGFVGQSGSTVAFDAAPADGASVPPPPAAPAPLPPGPPALTFGIVASRIGKAVTAGTLSGNVLSVKLAELGFPDGLHTVNARPDMWQKILDTLGA